MAGSLDSLISLLSENEQVLSDLAAALDEEQRCIVDLDLQQLAENSSRKMQIMARLGKFRDEGMRLMREAGTELGCTETPNLTGLLSVAGSREQARLAPLQQRLMSRARTVERQHEINRRILEKSNGMISGSLSLCARMLGSCDTYGAQGRISSGMAGVSTLRREI